MTTGLPCCPELPDGKQCDYIDFIYRLTHYTKVVVDDRTSRVPVEVSIHIRLSRCTGPLQLGNLVYSTTLLPGEKVRLFSMDRRSRFTFDAESELTYRHEQVVEEQYYMDAVRTFMSDLDSREDIESSSTGSGSYTQGQSGSGSLESFFGSSDASMAGNYNGKSTAEFIRELHAHAEASHNTSIQMTRAVSSVSIGEVQQRTHAEGESESHVEASSRTFSNPNRCHAVSYLFYQVDKVQTIRLQIVAVRTRVVDPAGSSAVKDVPSVKQPGVTVLPTALHATSDKLQVARENLERASLRPDLRTGFVMRPQIATAPRAEPIDATTRDLAIGAVQEDLRKERIVDERGEPTEEMRIEFEFEFRTSIPTPGVVVKGCLDDCNVCEPAREQEIKLELERQKLKNELLKRQVELLEHSQEYRCCPVGSEEQPEEA